MSASGSAGGRRCTAVLKPKQTLGDAPRLFLTTGWLAELSFGLVGPEQLQNSVIVQNNLRRAFAGARSGCRPAVIAPFLDRGRYGTLRDRRRETLAQLGDPS